MPKSAKRRKLTGVTRVREPPENWHEAWTLIQAHRAKSKAPVDTLGCHVVADDKGDATGLPTKAQRFQILIKLMMSSQTKDEVTHAAFLRLHARNLTSVDTIIAATENELDQLISPVGFHLQKARYMKRTAEMIRDKFDGDVPQSIDELVSLSGVGPKMAHLCMLGAWDKAMGIGVDVHVHRISNRLRWVRHTSNPEGTRMELESWLPKEHWPKINKMLVGFGQTQCTAKNPACATCPVRHLCPSSTAKPKREKASQHTAPKVTAGSSSQAQNNSKHPIVSAYFTPSQASS